jgi:hypothetical protein
VSLLTQQTVPANVGQVMLRMHLPEALSRQAAPALAGRTRGQR